MSQFVFYWPDGLHDVARVRRFPPHGRGAAYDVAAAGGIQVNTWVERVLRGPVLV